MTDTSAFEVAEPILSSPYEEPSEHWWIEEGRLPERRPGRRPAGYFYRDPLAPPADEDGFARGEWVELEAVNRIRDRLAQWRAEGYPGTTRTTGELIEYWHRDGREWPLFFAQLEAAETIIFLREARADFRQGIDVPLEDGGEFVRNACKMATGSGKTTVMGMLAAWSILNKAASRSDARFSDVALVICPNVTIRSRLRELDPNEGEASIYRTRDLVPPHLMPRLRTGRVLVKNWHEFELKGMQAGAKVQKRGRAQTIRSTIKVGDKTTTGRGGRYMTPQALELAVAQNVVRIVEDHRPQKAEVIVEETRYVESDTRWIQRVLAREVGGRATCSSSTTRPTTRTASVRRVRTFWSSTRRSMRRTSTSSLRRRPSGSRVWTASTGTGGSTSASTSPPPRTTWRVPGWRRTGSSRGS